MEEHKIYLLKLRGKHFLPCPLVKGKEYTASLFLKIKKIGDEDMDETGECVEYTYIAESTSPMAIVNQEGKKVYTKPKGSQSQQQRFDIMRIYNDSAALQETYKDFDSYYKYAMGYIRHNLKSILGGAK